MQSLSSLLNAFSIGTIDNKGDCMAAIVVVAPQFAQRVLTTDVPALELNIFVLKSLHVEPNIRDGIDCLVHLELVEYPSLACRIKAEEKDANVALVSSKSVIDAV